LVFEENKTLKFADIISNPVDKHSARVKWKQRFEHSSSCSRRSVSVRQQLKINSQPVASSSPHSPVNSPHQPVRSD